MTALQESAVLRADLLRGCSATATCCLLFSLGVHAAETLDMAHRGHYTLLTLHHVGTILTIAGTQYNIYSIPVFTSNRISTIYYLLTSQIFFVYLFNSYTFINFGLQAC